MPKVKFNIKLTKNQKKCIRLLNEDDTRYLICNWSRQCGKTVTSEILMIQYLCKPNTFNYYISPSFSQGRKVYNEITKLLEGKNIIKKANSSTLTVESVFGSILQFFSFENITAVRGYTVKNGLVVIDEAAFAYSSQEQDPFMSVIYPTIKANFKKNKVLVISTPKGKQGLFFNLWSKALSGEKGFKYMQATIYDDELVSEEQIEEIKKMMPSQIFQEEFECKFLDSSLTYFIGFENCFKEFAYNDSIKQSIGIDLSANGKDETILTKINTLRQVKQYKIVGTLDNKYKSIADIINETQNLSSVYIENNSIGTPIINEVMKLVKRKSLIHEWNTTNSSKNEILSNLAVSIANNEICFNEDDKELFSQFGSFITKYSKTGKLQLQAQSGCKDDRIMSLGIAYKALSDSNVEKKIASVIKI